MHLGLRLGLHTSHTVPGQLLPDIRTLASGWLDATDAGSYIGSGTSFGSLIAAPSDGTSAAANVGALNSAAIFTGAAGSPAAFFTLSGTQYIHQTAATLGVNSILRNAHRSDLSTGFWFAWAGVIPTGDAVAKDICGNALGTGTVGFTMEIATTGILTFTQRSSSASVSVPMLGVPRGVPVLIIASWNGALTTNNLRLWINTGTKAVYSAAFVASTAATGNDMYICSKYNGVNALPANAQFKGFLYGTSFLDNTQAQQILALLQTKHGVDYTGGGAFSSSRQLYAGLLGDSITYRNQYSTLAQGDLDNNGVGIFSSYNALLQQKFRLIKSNNMGVNGNKTSDVIARLGTCFNGTVCDVVFLMIGTNDIGLNGSGVSVAASTIAGINTILDYITGTIGKPVILETILPRSTWQDGVNGPADLLTVNAAIRLLNGSRNGMVTVVDTYAALNNGSNAPVANALIDGLHPTQYGAMLTAKYMVTALGSLFTPWPLPDFVTGNLLANGTMTGTTGIVSGAGLSGIAPTGWTLGITGGKTGDTATASKPSTTVAQISFAGASGASANIVAGLSQVITAGFAIGDTVYALALIEADTVTPVQVIENALRLTLAGSSLPATYNGRGMCKWILDNNIFTPETYLSPGQYLIKTPDMAITSGTGLSLACLVGQEGQTTVAAASGTIQVKGVGIFKR